jgi:dipeptide/tripeptide permease
MFGNLGAFTTPVLVPIVLEKWDVNGDWHEAFLLFSAGYLLALIAAFGINATRRID